MGRASSEELGLEAAVLRARYPEEGRGALQRDLAASLGVEVQTVRRIERRGLKRLWMTVDPRVREHYAPTPEEVEWAAALPRSIHTAAGKAYAALNSIYPVRKFSGRV